MSVSIHVCVQKCDGLRKNTVPEFGGLGPDGPVEPAWRQQFKEMGTRVWTVFLSVGGSTETPGGKDGL